MEKFMIRARFLTVLSFILVSASSYSAVKCGPELIKGVQIKKNGEIYLTSETGNRRLLAKDSSPSAKHMLDIAMKAVDSNLFIQISYPDGYSCDNPNLEIVADWVYIQNANRG